MSAIEKQMIRWYWRQVGGKLEKQEAGAMRRLPAVLKSSRG